MKKKSKIILAIILAVVLIIITPLYLRYHSNVKLGEELRKEADAWLASIPKIPESENGALIIKRGCQKLGELPESLQRLLYIESESDAAAFEQWLTENQQALDLIEKGLAYEKWAYTTDYEKGYAAAYPSLLLLKRAGYMLCFKGDLARLRGQHSEALRQYLKAVHLGSTLARERLLISRMIHVAIINRSLDCLMQAVCEKSLVAADLSTTLEVLLSEHKVPIEASAVYETEYYAFAMMMADFLTGKGIRSDVFDATGGARPLFPRWVRDYTQDVDKYKKYREICAAIEPQKYHGLPAEFRDWSVFSGKIGLTEDWGLFDFVEKLMPNIQESIKVLSETETLFRATVLLTAIRLYEAKNGVLPGNLDDLGALVPKEILTDPFSGKNLIYRREGDDFYLYSTGYNGKDDGGKDKPVYEDEVYPSEVSDIIFHAPPSGK